MTHAPVAESPFRISSRILLAGMVCLVFGLYGGLAAPMAFAQAGGHGGGGGSHGGGGHATSSGHSGAHPSAAHSSSGGHASGGHSGSFGGARGSSGGSHGAYGYSGSGSTSGETGSHLLSRPGGETSSHSGSATGEAYGFSGGAGAQSNSGAVGSAPSRGFTRMVFAAPAGQAAAQQGTAGNESLGLQVMSGGNAQEPRIEELGPGRPQAILNARTPVHYELVGGEWVVTGDAQQQRPVYTPPQPPQAPRPIVTPPMQSPVRPVAQPIPQNPIRPVGTPANPASPPIARIPGQPVVRFPIAQPPATPVQPIGRPVAPVPPPIMGTPGRFPVQPLTRVPVSRPRIGRVRLPSTPAFHPVMEPPIRRISGPFAFAGGAPPIRKVFDGMPRNGAPFVVMTTPPHFDAHPCFQTIGNCGFGFGFDGDFDFDDGFFFGFPFGSPFFFGPFGFPAFGFGFGPNCFFDGVVEPCAFTPVGFAQFQAFGPNGWGWSWLGWGNGWFYSPPQEPPPPPWNSTETNPGLNLQYFTNEWYLPYSEPEATPQAGAAPNENEPGAEQNQNVVTQIVTTDELVFGVTSYWLEDNQLCYVTTYNIKNCIPMSRVDLQKTVDMNYKRGVKFVLTPKPAEKPQSPDTQQPDNKE